MNNALIKEKEHLKKHSDALFLLKSVIFCGTITIFGKDGYKYEKIWIWTYEITPYELRGADKH